MGWGQKGKKHLSCDFSMVTPPCGDLSFLPSASFIVRHYLWISRKLCSNGPKNMNTHFPAQPLIENPAGRSIHQPGVAPKTFGATLGIKPQAFRPICSAPAAWCGEVKRRRRRRESIHNERSLLWANLIQPPFFNLAKLSQF